MSSPSDVTDGSRSTWSLGLTVTPSTMNTGSINNLSVVQSVHSSPEARSPQRTSGGVVVLTEDDDTAEIVHAATVEAVESIHSSSSSSSSESDSTTSEMSSPSCQYIGDMPRDTTPSQRNTPPVRSRVSSRGIASSAGGSVQGSQSTVTRRLDSKSPARDRGSKGSLGDGTPKGRRPEEFRRLSHQGHLLVMD